MTTTTTWKGKSKIVVTPMLILALGLVATTDSFQSPNLIQRQQELRKSRVVPLQFLTFATSGSASTKTSKFQPTTTRTTTSQLPMSITTKTSSSSSLKPNNNSNNRNKNSSNKFVPMKQTTTMKPVFLTHERDLIRQIVRLESMDSYVLVSTLTASMSFGALMGFVPSAASRAIIHVQPVYIKFIYRTLCLAIQIVSGLSALFGLYATIMFSLTILYGKSALGSERDCEYDDFLRATARARVNGFNCFSLSLGLFALEAFLVLAERTSFRWCNIPVCCTSAAILYHLYKDWKILFQNAEIIYK